MAHGKSIAILIAEDDPDDRLFSKEAFEAAHLMNQVVFVEDGQELMDYLNCRGKYDGGPECPPPSLILLDLNMPRKDGREALIEIKSNPRLRHIPVVVLTTSKADEDILKSYDLGVSGYITKPLTFERLIDIMKAIGKYWFEIVELPSPDWRE